MTSREYQHVNSTWMPSRGKAYPTGMEIYTSPLTIRERRLLEGCSRAEYYRALLDGIQIRGGFGFDKNKLLFCDVQFLDLVRRLYTFEANKSITVANYPCPHCKTSDVSVKFQLTDIEFEDLDPEVFSSTREITNEAGEIETIELPGKVFTFSDGLEVLVGPLTVGEYIDLASKYIVNITEDTINEKFTEMWIAQFAYLIKDVIGREYKDADMRRDFLISYLNDLYKEEDENILDNIEDITNSVLIPLKGKCPTCDKEVEVYVQSSLRFQQ